MVEPFEDTAPDFLPRSISQSTSKRLDSSKEVMEVDSRLPATQLSGGHHRAWLDRQPLEVGRASLPSTRSRSPSAAGPLPSPSQKIPSQTSSLPGPISKVMQETHAATQPAMKETSNGVTSEVGTSSSLATQSRSPREVHQSNGTRYPRQPNEVGLDAIERLQTQISQNSGALAAHTRDIRRGEESFQKLEEALRQEFQGHIIRQSSEIRRVDEAVATLHHELQRTRQVMESLSIELHAVRADRQSRGSTVPPQASGAGVQDSAIELMAQQVAVISQKANEVDMLKITLEIMKNKIQRLEEGTIVGTPVAMQQPYQHQVEPASHAAHAAPSVPSTSAPRSHSSTTQASQTTATTQLATSPETPQTHEMRAETSSGWASINAGVKRPNPSEEESGRVSRLPGVPGSPKRPRMTTFESPDTRPLEYASQMHAHTPNAEGVLGSQVPSSGYGPYSTQDGYLDDGWHAEAQRMSEHRPRGRGRGGGPGSRGGRGRKSLPAQTQAHAWASEWERDDWQGVLDSHGSPDSSYSHHMRGRGIARRGSGGAGAGMRSSYATAHDRAVVMGMTGAAGMAMSPSGDAYAHTKKTRTKPIRNADGVLIRKDGRPDMRSQSSAANLRKVHARKEDQAQSPTASAYTPTKPYTTSGEAHETSSPEENSPPDHDTPGTVNKKHNAIMSKMFPSGVEESRKQHDFTRHVFEEEQDHTVHLRTQTHQQTERPSLAQSEDSSRGGGETARQEPHGDDGANAHTETRPSQDADTQAIARAEEQRDVKPAQT